MTVRRPSLLFTAGSVLAGCLFLAGAANFVLRSAGAEPISGTAPTSKSKNVIYKGENYTARETAQGTILTLAGNVSFLTEDSTLLTALATFNRTTSVADSPGRLSIDDTKNNVVGDRGVAYYKTREAKITGNVVITVKPKNQPARPAGGDSSKSSVRSQFDAPATIYCDNVDYFWSDRVAVATGKLTMKFKDYVVTADKATFYGKIDRVDLSGNVHFVRTGKQDSGTTPIAQAIITEGKEQLLTGHIEGVQQIDSEEEKPSGAPAPPPQIDIHGGTIPTAPTGTPTVPGSPATIPTPAAPPAATPVTIPPATPTATPNAAPTPTGGQP